MTQLVEWTCGCVREVHPEVKTPPHIGVGDYDLYGSFGYCNQPKEHGLVRVVRLWSRYDLDMDSQAEDEYPELCDCGYPPDSFACKIRHIGISMPNSEARQQDKYLAGVKQEDYYGI